MRLYHFTCHHWADAIGKTREVRPTSFTWAQLDGMLTERDLPATGLAGTPTVAWLTDLVKPSIDACGLRPHDTACHRMAFRFEVGDTHLAVPWLDWAVEHGATIGWRAVLESRGCRPDRWWVSTEALPVLALTAFKSDGPKIDRRQHVRMV